jgi:hypothetical protein
MANDPRPVDYAGYGAIYALHGILVASLDILVTLVQEDARFDIRPFLAVANGMIATIHSLQIGPVWSDARLRFLLLAYRYRDLIQALTIADHEAFQLAAAELREAQTISAAALLQLAENLGLLPLKARTA